jgi:hypothetical protein
VLRYLLAFLLCLGVHPALADWAYVPPPVDAVVVYDDGHSSRIDAVSADRFTLINKLGKKTERVVFRTWLLRERLMQGKRSDELFLDSAAAQRIIDLWPLQPGETLTHSFRTESRGKLISTGTQVLTYEGVEHLETPAGAFEAHRLARKYMLTKVSDGLQYHGGETTWHDTATGLILRVDWWSDDPESGGQGMYQATEVELP